MKKTLTKEEFHDLLAEIGKEPKRALKIFFDLYGKLIYWSAYSVCRSAAAADEVLNDVLLKIWQLSSATPSVENPESWLYKISVNTAKKKRDARAVPLDESIAEPQNAIDAWIEEDSFYSYLDGLTEEEQFILIARFVQDMKFEEIAAALELPLSTVSTKYYRTLNKIKQRMKR